MSAFEPCPDCTLPGKPYFHSDPRTCPFRGRYHAVPSPQTCSVEGCERSAERKDSGRRGMCRTHYRALVAAGGHLPRLTPEERFLSHLRLSTEQWYGGKPCIEWTGFLNGGYGQFQLAPQRPVPAYRWAYLHWVGPVPDGLELDHLCRNRACVNPWHLEPVTHAENIRRGGWGAHNAAERSKTHCVNGHERVPENLLVDASGSRRCRLCVIESSRARRRRQAQQREAS